MEMYDMHNNIKVTTSNAVINKSAMLSNGKYKADAYDIPTASDDGVFVGVASNKRYYLTNHTNSTDKVITGKAFGGIPIWPNYNPVIVGIVVTDAAVPRIALRFRRHTSDSFTGYESAAWSGSVYEAASVESSKRIHDYKDFNISVIKTEITDTFYTKPIPHWYVTGFDASINSSDLETEHLQMAFITLLPPGQEILFGHTVSIDGFNYAHTTEPTFVINGNGDILYTIQNGIDSVLPKNISQAFPEEVITASNTGIFAVSCMIATSTNPAWPGRKNGIYRVYNGSKELIGEPGERINIGKHEFAYFMHSSYVFRIS